MKITFLKKKFNSNMKINLKVVKVHKNVKKYYINIC